MSNKPNNLLEWMAMMSSPELPTKRQFGEQMHSMHLSEAEKAEVARRVMMAGGYACLLSN